MEKKPSQNNPETNTTGTNSFKDFPDDVITIIFPFLGLKEIQQLSLVKKSFRQRIEKAFSDPNMYSNYPGMFNVLCKLWRENQVVFNEWFKLYRIDKIQPSPTPYNQACDDIFHATDIDMLNNALKIVFKNNTDDITQFLLPLVFNASQFALYRTFGNTTLQETLEAQIATWTYKTAASRENIHTLLFCLLSSKDIKFFNSKHWVLTNILYYAEKNMNDIFEQEAITKYGEGFIKALLQSCRLTLAANRTEPTAEKINAIRKAFPNIPINFAGANLRYAKLTGADLGGADLGGANLTGAHLTGAYLRGADLGDANLTGADLGGANLTGANLTGANLERADLTGANLTGAKLTGMKLTGVNLTSANLIGADLSYADLSYAYLMRADLMRADLKGADLTDAKLMGAGLTRADLRGADLTNANLTCADFTNSNLFRCVFSSNTKLDGIKINSFTLLSVFINGINPPNTKTNIWSLNDNMLGAFKLLLPHADIKELELLMQNVKKQISVHPLDFIFGTLEKAKLLKLISEEIAKKQASQKMECEKPTQKESISGNSQQNSSASNSALALQEQSAQVISLNPELR